jgi:hypothetical protein
VRQSVVTDLLIEKCTFALRQRKNYSEYKEGAQNGILKKTLYENFIFITTPHLIPKSNGK